ncbi:LD-carboxypeptidase [Fusibacter sp. 3D3]|uniref:S66 peptidase family protein n=1 Tax=Fusibacter sp. 3D3 TaxID=1048380 RepID=UPI000852A762|nr:LD-carboxypeptidase [Fusibacter sp. 3D3]GAU76238.1 muramoyltetrapeptide carboxypeptidase [Fusibacter sp. 3D3]
MKVKPKRLKKGDTIAIISPSSGIWRRSELLQSVEALEKLGYKVKLGEHVLKNRLYLAGTDEERASDFIWAFEDSTVDAIFASQGGYGAARLLRYINFDVVSRNPKIFLGYSDVTALHLAIQKETDLVTFNGPSALSFGTEYMTPYRFEHLMKALLGDEPIGHVKMSDPLKYLIKMNPGVVEGEITGGNLSLICSLLGTPWEIDTKDKILFLEDLEMEPWQMDHLLIHLLNAGKLSDASAIVVGECKNCEPYRHNPGFPNQCSLEDVLFDILEPLKKPVLYRLPLGHTKDLATIPLGVRGRVDSEKGIFEVMEKGVV